MSFRVRASSDGRAASAASRVEPSTDGRSSVHAWRTACNSTADRRLEPERPKLISRNVVDRAGIIITNLTAKRISKVAGRKNQWRVVAIGRYFLTDRSRRRGLSSNAVRITGPFARRVDTDPGVWHSKRARFHPSTRRTEHGRISSTRFSGIGATATTNSWGQVRPPLPLLREEGPHEFGEIS